MVKELIVHLGDTKTGSTSIQKALASKAYEVPGTTVFYPAKTHHNALARTLARKRYMAERKKRFSRVNEALKSSNADFGVVSAEHFQFVDPESFAQSVREYWPDFQDRMRLVAYVRPHHEKLLSSFSERVKLGQVSGRFETFADEFLAGPLLDYLPRLQRWQDVFGDRFVVRPFVRNALHDQDVLADFFYTMLGHTDFTIAQDEASNSSLTLSQLALLRLVHRTVSERRRANNKKMMPVIFEARSALGRTVSEHINAQGLGVGDARLALPKALVTKVQQRYQADAAALDAQFFADMGTPMSDALAAAGRKAVSGSQSLKASDYFGPETIAAVQALAGILAEMLVKQPKHFGEMAGKTRLMFSGSEKNNG
ncbi:hypothetical protein [Pseudophaeobacter sp.]|jgi:hypothetical protein|uniref:hypothetical protein n=1 Tax=Pseudophaeobacter sp. TaxID=1971739 RepID=UPI0032D90B26